jgi:hypothetical protein
VGRSSDLPALDCSFKVLRNGRRCNFSHRRNFSFLNLSNIFEPQNLDSHTLDYSIIMLKRQQCSKTHQHTSLSNASLIALSRASYEVGTIAPASLSA